MTGHSLIPITLVFWTLLGVTPEHCLRDKAEISLVLQPSDKLLGGAQEYIWAWAPQINKYNRVCYRVASKHSATSMCDQTLYYPAMQITYVLQNFLVKCSSTFLNHHWRIRAALHSACSASCVSMAPPLFRGHTTSHHFELFDHLKSHPQSEQLLFG